MQKIKHPCASKPVILCPKTRKFVAQNP